MTTQHGRAGTPDNIILEHEAKITADNIARVSRYMTQCLEFPQLTQAMLRLSMQTYKGRPLSNSFLIHELTELEAFEALGQYFASPDLEKATEEERRRILADKTEKYKRIRAPHLTAIKTQNEYLAAVACKRGYSLSPGTVLRFSVFTPKVEVEEAERWDPNLKPAEQEFDHAKAFAFDLLRQEPAYGQIFSELNKQGLIKSGSHLYETYPVKIEDILRTSQSVGT